MDPNAIIQHFETIIDDSLDPVYEVTLFNLVKNQVENERNWRFLLTMDNSQVATTSDNYLTPKTLPANFNKPDVLFLLGELTPYIIIPLRERDRYKDIYKRWYIDYSINPNTGSRQFYLCGHVDMQRTINLYYYMFTPDLTLVAGKPDPSYRLYWDAQFHIYLAYRMAEYHMAGADVDDVNARLSTKDQAIADQLKHAMVMQDASRRRAEFNDKMNGSIDYSTYPNIVDLR